MRFRRWEWLIVFAALICDLNSWGHQFVMDDLDRIVGSQLIQSPGHWLEIFTSSFNHPLGLPGDLYRPLTTFSFALNYWISGLSPDPFHLFNRLLHVLTCLGIFWVLRRLFANPQVALFTTLLFAVHPVQTEAITYLNGRSDSLAMLCFVFAWLFFVRARREAAFPRRSYGLSLLFYFLALLSKESAITWLGVALLTEWVFFAQGSLKRLGEDWRSKLLHVYAGYLAVTAVYLLLRFSVLRSVGTIYVSMLDNPIAHAATSVRVITALKVMFKSIALFLWPVHLSADYSYNQIPVITPWASPTALIWIALSVVLLVLLGWSWKRAIHVFFALGFFVVTYSVVSNLLIPIGTIMAERTLYMPLLGFCLVGGIALARVNETASKRGFKKTFYLIVVVVLTALAGRTVLRNRDWLDEMSLYQQTVRVSPQSAKAQNNLGAQYYQKNQFDLAWQHYQIAEKIKPDYPDLIYNMGTLRLREGKLDEAITYLRRAVALAPRGPVYRNNLGVALRMRGRVTEAIEQYDEVLKEYPENADAHFNRGNALYYLGRIDDAIREYNRTLEIDPQYADARRYLTLLQQMKNSSQEKPSPRELK